MGWGTRVTYARRKRAPQEHPATRVKGEHPAAREPRATPTPTPHLALLALLGPSGMWKNLPQPSTTIVRGKDAENYRYWARRIGEHRAEVGQPSRVRGRP